ncbi:MAG: hypothetical protein ACP5JB_07045 [candidate division WOR-3 bacterium]|jgi:hypothetical protein
MKWLFMLVSAGFGLLFAVWTPVGPVGGNIYCGDISGTSPAVIYLAP